MAIDVHRFLNFLLGSWHNQYLIFRWITREVVGFISATSCIPVLLKTADDVVNLLTRNIYLVVVSVSTQLKSNVFIKQIILIKIPRHWTKWWPLRASTSTCEHYILVCKVTRRTTDTNICRGGRSKRVFPKLLCLNVKNASQFLWVTYLFLVKLLFDYSTWIDQFPYFRIQPQTIGGSWE